MRGWWGGRIACRCEGSLLTLIVLGNSGCSTVACLTVYFAHLSCLAPRAMMCGCLGNRFVETKASRSMVPVLNTSLILLEDFRRNMAQLFGWSAIRTCLRVSRAVELFCCSMIGPTSRPLSPRHPKNRHPAARPVVLPSTDHLAYWQQPVRRCLYEREFCLGGSL